MDEKKHKIGEYLIWNIKDDGYLDEALSLENVAEIYETSVKTVESVLKKIQFFDPVGVGARDLQECLLVQLKDMDKPSKLAVTVIKDHFNDFKNKRYDKIINTLQIETEALKEVLIVISKLNPKPGFGIINIKNNYIIPDFIIEKVDNEFLVTLNDWNIPPLRISKTYKQLLTNKKKPSTKNNP